MESPAHFRALVALRAKRGEFTALDALHCDLAVQPLREAGSENARAGALRLVSAELVNSGSFSGPGYSWGDDRLAEAAGGGGSGLGGTGVPVAYATSHHLAYLNDFAAA